MALELSKYLSKETQVMAVQQGFSELVPLYKLMEKRDMFDFVNQMKVGEGAAFQTCHIVPHLKHPPCIHSVQVTVFSFWLEVINLRPQCCFSIMWII